MKIRIKLSKDAFKQQDTLVSMRNIVVHNRKNAFKFHDSKLFTIFFYKIKYDIAQKKTFYRPPESQFLKHCVKEQMK